MNEASTLKWLNRIIKIVITLSIISIGLVVCKFHDGRLSNKFEDWGAFGDYIGGVLGAIIASANLFIFIIISLLLAKMQDKASDENIKAQLRIKKTDLRYNYITYISTALDKYIYKIPTGNDFVDDTIVITEILRSYMENYKLLFPNLDTTKMIDSLTAIVKIIKAPIIDSDGQKKLNKPAYEAEYKKFINEKDAFIKSLLEEILNGIN